MIGKLTGRLDSISENGAIIDVRGVGYSVFSSSRTLGQLGGVGDLVSVKIETHVREDHIHLFAFATEEERLWFQLLTTVQGVGAKAALAILSALSSEEISDSLLSEDKSMLCRAEGVGLKLATRIITELKEKAGNFSVVNVSMSSNEEKNGNSHAEDAISAMVNLGFARGEAQRAVSNVIKKSGSDTLDQLIGATLKELAS